MRGWVNEKTGKEKTAPRFSVAHEKRGGRMNEISMDRTDPQRIRPKSAR